MKNKKESIEIPEIVEKRLQEAYQQIGAGSKKKPVWNKGLAVAAAVAVLVAGIGIPYVAEGKFSVRELFENIWGNQIEQSAVDKINGGVEVLKEKSTFDKLSIELVQAVVDRMGAYVVMKVMGKNGFTLEENMAFGDGDGDLRYDDSDLNFSYDDWVLKREENTFYYVARVIMDEPVPVKSHPILHIRIYTGLVRGEFDEYGRLLVKYDNEVDKEDGCEISRISEESYVFKGEYKADIRCSQSEDMVSVSLGDGVAAKINPLGVYINKDYFDQIAVVGIPEDYQNAHILLKDGREVEARPSSGTEGKDTRFVSDEPVDIEQVKGMRIVGETYLVE